MPAKLMFSSIHT